MRGMSGARSPGATCGSGWRPGAGLSCGSTLRARRGSKTTSPRLVRRRVPPSRDAAALAEVARSLTAGATLARCSKQRPGSSARQRFAPCPAWSGPRSAASTTPRSRASTTPRTPRRAVRPFRSRPRRRGHRPRSTGVTTALDDSAALEADLVEAVPLRETVPVPGETAAVPRFRSVRKGRSRGQGDPAAARRRLRIHPRGTEDRSAGRPSRPGHPRAGGGAPGQRRRLSGGTVDPRSVRSSIVCGRYGRVAQRCTMVSTGASSAVPKRNAHSCSSEPK